MRLADMKVDSNAIENGVWIGNIPDMGSLRLKVRGVGNAAHQAEQTKLYAATPRSEKTGGRLSPAASDRIMAHCLAKATLLDWEGIEGDDGQPLPYSPETALTLLSDPAYRVLRDAVLWASGQVGQAPGTSEAA